MGTEAEWAHQQNQKALEELRAKKVKPKEPVEPTPINPKEIDLDDRHSPVRGR